MNWEDTDEDVVMHMIGYGCLEVNFTDSLDSCDHESLLELAKACENRWMSEGTLTNPLKKAIERYNMEE